MLYAYEFPSITGPIRITANDTHITGIMWIEREKTAADTELAFQKTPLIAQAEIELNEYFAGKRTAFSVPLSPQGTPFQKRVWDALCAIPYGETRSYAQIAAAVGSPKGFRAVGGANHHNPIVIMIPCHRVIGADGSLTGFGGGLPVKELLLHLEREHAGKGA